LSLGFQVFYIAHLPYSLAIGSRMNLHSVWITHHIKQVHLVKPQENHILLTSLSP